MSAFVASNEKRIDDGYDVELICKYLDYASVATYDYTGPSDSKTGYNAPLYSRSNEKNNIVRSFCPNLTKKTQNNSCFLRIHRFMLG